MQLVAGAYFSIGWALELNWFRKQIIMHPVDSLWSALAKTTWRDNLDEYQRMLTIIALGAKPKCKTVQERVATWLENNQQITERWRLMMEKMQVESSVEPLMFSVALHELLDLANQLK